MNAQETTTDVLRLAEVIAKVKLSRASIYRLMAAGKFPQALQIGERAVGWPSDEIDSWITTRPRTAPQRSRHALQHKS